MIVMPWGEPRPIVLSEGDRKILHEVKQACSDLMLKLSELDAYVSTLNIEVDHRKSDGGGDGQPTTTATP